MIIYLAFLETECLSQCFTAVKRYNDQSNLTETIFKLAWLTGSEIQIIIFKVRSW